MAKPAPKTALRKAPAAVHPIAPTTEVVPEQQAPAAPPAPESAAEPAPLAMFSVRMDPALRRRVKRYAAEADTSLQDVTAAALAEYLERHNS